MKYRPRRIHRNVNVSPESPLHEFFILAGGIVGGLLVIYIILGLALELVVPRLPHSVEERLVGLFAPTEGKNDKTTEAEARLQGLLDDIAARWEEREWEFQVHLVPDEQANAIALPGGHIVVLSGLVKEAASENELAMVLAHELGHFRDRDHLRGLGRGLVLVFLSSVLFGSDSAVSGFTSAFLGGAEMKFSQRQELKADAWGLDLLVRKYGHAGGATDFFRRLGEVEEGKELKYFFASHPYPRERVESLEAMIRERGYAVHDPLPLDGAYLDAEYFSDEE